MTYRIFCVVTAVLLVISTHSLTAQSSVYPDTVVAQSGEGIFAILRRLDLDPSKSLPDFVELNRERIGKDSSLVKGTMYLIPPVPPLTSASGPSDPGNVPGSGNTDSESNSSVTDDSKSLIAVEPLFGTKYERVNRQDNQLDGAVFYLVGGHAGPDPGAIGQYGPYPLSEDEYAYDVTLRLARRLMEHGATVYMIVQDKNDGIRDSPILEMDKDEVHYPNKTIPYNQRNRLRERVSVINELYVKHKGAYQRMLALHIDSRSRGENIDVFFYIHANSSNGEKLASNIHETFTQKYRRHQPNRSYHGSVTTRSGLFVIKYSYPPTVFIELGNIKNEKDQRRFVLPDNRQALANWITEGILRDRKQAK